MTLDAEGDVHDERRVTLAAHHTLWRAGELSYLLHEGREPTDPIVERYASGLVPERRGQIQAYRHVQRCIAGGLSPILVMTGRQWGKSFFLVVLFSEMCVRRALLRATEPGRHEPLRIPYAAETQKQVSEFVRPHFQRLRDLAPPELCPEEDRGTWVFPDESRIVVSGCEDRKKADRLRGPKAHAAAIDEAGFIDIADYVMRSVIGWQLATTGGPLIVTSTPPEQSDHVFVDLWADAEARGAAFRSTTPEAPHMSEPLLDAAIERSGGEASLHWRREGLALILRDERQAVLPEWSDDAVREPERPDHYLPIVVGDQGYVDLFVVVFGYYDFVNDLDVIEDEVVLQHTDSVTVDRAVRERELALWGERDDVSHYVDAPVQVRADMSRARHQSIGEVEKVRPTKWDVIANDELPEQPTALFWQPVRKDHLHAGVNETRTRLASGRIAVHSRCITVRAHAEYARWNRGRTEFDRPQSREHHYDGAAALVYFVRMLDRASNPLPRVPERPLHVKRDDWWVDPAVRRRQEAADALFKGRRHRAKGRRR